MSRASDLRKALDALDVFDEACMDADFDIDEGEDADEFTETIKSRATEERSALGAMFALLEKRLMAALKEEEQRSGARPFRNPRRHR